MCKSISTLVVVHCSLYLEGEAEICYSLCFVQTDKFPSPLYAHTLSAGTSLACRLEHDMPSCTMSSHQSASFSPEVMSSHAGGIRTFSLAYLTHACTTNTGESIYLYIIYITHTLTKSKHLWSISHSHKGPNATGS